MSNERFNNNKGDIEFKRCQCEFCRYNCKDENGIDKKTCPKYPDGKPDEVLQTKVKCPFLDFQAMLQRNAQIFRGIPGYRKFDTVRRLRGLSSEEKYYIKTKEQQEFLLKVSNIPNARKMDEEPLWLNYLESHGILTNRVLDYGSFHRHRSAYTLLSWIPGMSVSDVLNDANNDVCLQLGYKAGTLLRQIHKIKPPQRLLPQAMSRVIDECIFKFSCDDVSLEKYPSMNVFLDYLKKHKHIDLHEETYSILHGDFHTGNLIFYDNRICAIDWIRGACGNPIDDFVRNIVNGSENRAFASAQIDAYFDGNVPESFWLELAILTAIHELKITEFQFPDAKNGEAFVSYQHGLVVDQYNSMQLLIPKYYSHT